MESLNFKRSIVLNNNLFMPQFGLGVYLSTPGEETYLAVRYALDAGYRHIDTASLYANEADVGRAIRDSDVAREQVFITSKVWNDDQGYDSCHRAIRNSLRLLQTDWIDLYLIHWPIKKSMCASYRAMEEAYQQGLLKAIGVSNFKEAHIDELVANTSVAPAVNQVECHPRLQQASLLHYCQQRNIIFESWRPLMAAGVAAIPLLVQLANKYEKDPFQIAIRWLLQRGIVVIPKSVKKERIISNTNVFNFLLEDKEMTAISRLDQAQRLGNDPDIFSYYS